MSEHQPEQQPKDEPREQGSEQERPSAPPRIWVGSLADYNSGVLHGEWLDAARPAEAILADIQAMLARSRQPLAEDWGIFDHENFGTFHVGEYESIEVVSRVARGIAEHGLAFAVWAEVHDADPDMLEAFEDSYLGEYEAVEDWAQQVLDERRLEAELDRAIPDSLRQYVSIDYAAFARDAELGGDIYVQRMPDGRVWIFSSA